MSRFMLVVIPLVLLGGFMSDIGFPRFFAFSSEIGGIVAAVVIVIAAARRRIAEIRPVYWILFSLIVLHLLFGILANNVQIGTIIIGSRTYLRTIPFFILPLVFLPQTKELRHQFVAVIVLACIQLPLAFQQRMSTLAVGNYSGDKTVGTLLNSGMLSVFLICVSSVVFTMYLRKKLSLIATGSLLILLLVPTMINETKATIFMIPFAFLIPVLALPSSIRKKSMATGIVATGAFLAAFVPTYDHFSRPTSSGGIVEFLTTEGRVESYLKRDTEVGSEKGAARLDAIILPMKTLGHDPTAVTLGLGMGTVTESIFGPQYEGKYVSRYGKLVGGTVSRLLWEIGWLGLVLVCSLFLPIFNDSRALRDRPDVVGILAHSWIAIVPLIVVGMIYKNLMLSPAISVLFWYFSGVVVAHAAKETQIKLNKGQLGITETQ